MELPQSLSFDTTQGRKATHDFLSLYSHSSLSQDPRPSHGDFLRTHNFLQPLDGEQKNSNLEDNVADVNIKPPSVAPSTSLVEHLLPGGIGTYSIRSHPYLTQKVPKPGENSNDRNDSHCSSYTGRSFMLWDEPTMKRRNPGKENLGGVNLSKEATKAGLWPLDRPSQSSSNHRSSVSPLSSSQALPHKSQSFMDMLKCAKRSPSMEEEDEEDLSIQKENSSCQSAGLQVKVDGKNSDWKANTPRSKHSATEQRRRCKINDRFQRLREIIPHGDQKRDKASFLQEVIEYIQFLQEKVNRYEGPELNSEPAKFNLRTNHGPIKSFVDQPRAANGIMHPVLMSGAKLDRKATTFSLDISSDTQTPAECDVINSIDFKTVGLQSGLLTKERPISSTLPPNIYACRSSSVTVAQPPASLPQLQLTQSTSECELSATCVKLKDQKQAVEGGTINISNIYSHRLLSTLTRALQNSGVDLSQADVSVQVDVGKLANNRHSVPDAIPKSFEAPCINQSLLSSRCESTSDEPDRMIKKLKTG